MSTEQEDKSRDRLWESVYETHYYSSYHELSSEYLFARWQFLDELNKVIVAITASGSAIAGWALWSDPEYKNIWVFLAGLAALVSIVHSALGVPNKLREHSNTKRLFSSLRIDLETLRYQMEIFTDFDIREYNEEFLKLRKKYQEGVDGLPDDLLFTKCLAKKIQSSLNERITKE
jgi:CHAD domain-containing protein